MNEFQPTLAAADRIGSGSLKSLALVNLAAVSVENSRAHRVERPRDALAQRNRVRHRSRFALRLYARAQVPPLRQLIGIYAYRTFRQPVFKVGCIRAHLLGGGAMTTILPKAKTQHLIVKEIDDETLIWGMVMYPNRAPKLGRTQSPEPGIAEKHFGFEFWLTVSLFLFLAALIIAQWLSSALVKPLEAAGAIYSPAHDRAH
jgi:hypothetical protein